MTERSTKNISVMTALALSVAGLSMCSRPARQTASLRYVPFEARTTLPVTPDNILELDTVILQPGIDLTKMLLGILDRNRLTAGRELNVRSIRLRLDLTKESWIVVDQDGCFSFANESKVRCLSASERKTLEGAVSPLFPEWKVDTEAIRRKLDP